MTEKQDEISIIHNIENESGFMQDAIINKKAIRRSDFTLSEKHNFDYKSFTNIFSRKNIIYFGKIVGEEPIPIEQTKGNIIIPIINQKQIRDRIMHMKENDRSKIAYIHISTIQVILKSTFMGCDTPIKLELRDDRIIDRQESIIAQGKGNLSEGKLKFDLNIQMGLSLKDKDLSKSITVRYELLRRTFMHKGNHPFTITYQINYALTNSHHSITFKTKDVIHIDELFKPLLSLETVQKQCLFANRNLESKKRSNFIDSSIWMPQIEKPFSVFNGETSSSTNIRKSFSENRSDDIKEIKEMVRSLSLRI